MENLPVYVPILFVLTTLLSLGFFFKAGHGRLRPFLVLLPWIALQGALAAAGFYLKTDTLPPRFVLAVGPPLLLIGLLFATKAGRNWIDSLDSAWLTLLHSVRVPVEMVLLFLFLGGAVPGVMTFEGRNFDILSGITAPLVYWLGYRRQVLGRGWLIAWNLVCIGLLVNVVGHAALAIPSPFQQLAFEQPNVGVLVLPYIWLPSVIVPMVLFAHLASLRALLRTHERLVFA